MIAWMQWHQLEHMQTICIFIQTDNQTNTSSLNFYRPAALPDTQPTLPKALKDIKRQKICRKLLVLKPDDLVTRKATMRCLNT